MEAIKMTKSKKTTQNLTEDQEQTILATWLTKKGIKFFAIPNGGYRNPMEAVKLRRMGVQSGVPDLCIPYAQEPYHGLYIELKRVGPHHVSDAQKYWIDFLQAQGYCAKICIGFDEARIVIEDYLKMA